MVLRAGAADVRASRVAQRATCACPLLFLSYPHGPQAGIDSRVPCRC
jgi:hypothetical protein